ncbi:MAG: substrate-binding domain-containing protein [Clostridiales bacterium]|nr:substrate-binding domain-containing protein [Clostridiales bacterium]
MNRKIKTIISTILCLCLLAGLATGCSGSGGGSDSSAKGVKMYMTVSQADTFRTSLMETAQEVAESMGAQITIVDAGNLLENQLEQIREAVSGGYDVILCNPVDVDTTLEIEVMAGDIPIVFWNSCPDDAYLEKDKYVFVGSSEDEAGTFQGEYIVDKFSNQDTINVVVMEGQKMHSATLGRTNSLKAVLKASGKTINYVFMDYADWDEDLAREQFSLFLKTGQEADVVACNNDTMALGVMDACREAGVDPSDYVILGVDATADGCAAIESGDMAFTVYQSAVGQGEYAVKAAARLAQGHSLSGLDYLSDDGKYVWVPFERVDISNVSDYE